MRQFQPTKKRLQQRGPEPQGGPWGSLGLGRNAQMANHGLLPLEPQRSAPIPQCACAPNELRRQEKRGASAVGGSANSVLSARCTELESAGSICKNCAARKRLVMPPLHPGGRSIYLAPAHEEGEREKGVASTAANCCRKPIHRSVHTSNRVLSVPSHPDPPVWAASRAQTPSAVTKEFKYRCSWRT